MDKKIPRAHAKHDGVRRRIEIEAQDRCRFFFEPGIGTCDVRGDAVRLEAGDAAIAD